MKNPTVKKKIVEGDVVLYVEGSAGQRMRIRVFRGEDLMRVMFEHDETVELEPPNEVKVGAVRWWA